MTAEDTTSARVAAAVRTGLREGWRDDYSVDSVVEAVTAAVVAALDAQPGDAEQAGGWREQALMDAWWAAMEDDWAVPDWAPGKFLDECIRRGWVARAVGGPDDEQPDFRPAIISGLEVRFKAVLAACELAEAEARHVVDDEVYVSVGLIRNALRTTTPASGGPDAQPGDAER